MVTFLDQDIAHIVRVMWPSLCGDLDRSILPADYWRRRLYRLLDSSHLTKAQLCTIDDLLLQLDQFGYRTKCVAGQPVVHSISQPERASHEGL